MMEAFPTYHVETNDSMSFGRVSSRLGNVLFHFSAKAQFYLDIFCHSRR